MTSSRNIKPPLSGHINGYFARDSSRTLFSERTWRNVRCASNLSHGKTRMGATQANDSGLSTKFEAACIPDSQAHDRGVAPESPICVCDARLVNLLFIAAGNVSVVCQWERFLLQDCMIEHRFLSGGKHRGHKVDGLYCKRYSGIRQDRDFQLSHRGWEFKGMAHSPREGMQRADTHLYIRVYAIDESRHCGWYRDYHCGGGAPFFERHMGQDA
jgi:hypothetical protein